MTNTQGKQMCTCHCGHTHQINEREIPLYQGMVQALWNVMRWCTERGIHEFKIDAVKHLFDKSSYARFNDWNHFGGLVYRVTENNKPKRGEYGLNIERCQQFFVGRYQVPKVVWKNPITKTYRAGEYVTINQLPHLTKFLDENRQFIATYRRPEPKPVTVATQEQAVAQQMLI